VGRSGRSSGRGSLGQDAFDELALNPDVMCEAGLDFLDWSNDGCSKSSDGVFGTGFLGACTRQDFTYRNRRAWGPSSGRTFSAGEARADADHRLKDGIQEVCGAIQCDWSSYIYGGMVHAYGDGIGNLLPWDGLLPWV
jgi:Prokaryotic phospholipase A2